MNTTCDEPIRPEASADGYAVVVCARALHEPSTPAEHWFPEAAIRMDRPIGRQLTFAVDGSVDPEGHWGAAAVSTRGDVRLRTGVGRYHAATAEVEAIILALEMIGELAPPRAAVFVDSNDALFTAKFLYLSRQPRQNRGIDLEVRERLEAAISAIDCPIQWSRVKAHSQKTLPQNLLNDAADHVAWIGRRTTRSPRSETEPLLAEALSVASEDIVAKVAIRGCRRWPLGNPAGCQLKTQDERVVRGEAVIDNRQTSRGAEHGGGYWD